MKKLAFTLAEVLITLTIIGVIAALTIPNLIQSYRKHQVEVGIKEAYTILSNALVMAKSEHGSLEEAIQISYTKSNPKEYFSQNYLEPYLKVTKSLNADDTYKEKIFTDPILKRMDGSTENQYITDPCYWRQLLLSNGMFVGIYEREESFILVVDVNGGKGPNQIAHDIFYFGVEKNEPNKLFAGELTSFPGYYLKPNLCDDPSTVTYGGIHCSGAIQSNGWKIPDSYGVKKW